MMPQQKPGHSRQDYQTPKELLDAVKRRLRIGHFSIDLAASFQNAVNYAYYTKEDDALREDRTWNPERGAWAWLNPPFAHIEPWVAKAEVESSRGAHIVVLVPASVGSNWWKNHVEPFAYTAFLNGRITFVGAEDPYPKDCALVFYTPWGFRGSEVWTWQ